MWRRTQIASTLSQKTTVVLLSLPKKPPHWLYQEDTDRTTFQVGVKSETLYNINMIKPETANRLVALLDEERMKRRITTIEEMEYTHSIGKADHS